VRPATRASGRQIDTKLRAPSSSGAARLAGERKRRSGFRRRRLAGVAAQQCARCRSLLAHSAAKSTVINFCAELGTNVTLFLTLVSAHSAAHCLWRFATRSHCTQVRAAHSTRTVISVVRAAWRAADCLRRALFCLAAPRHSPKARPLLLPPLAGGEKWAPASAAPLGRPSGPGPGGGVRANGSA